MNTTILGLEIRRIVRDPVNLFFTAVLPAFFYLIFGAAQDYGKEDIGRGNVAFLVMVAMAAYGAVSATVAIGGSAAVERSQGWGRQLGLTPLADSAYVAVKGALAVSIAAIPITLVFLLGALTGARATSWVWALSAAILLAGAMVFALYGLSFGLAFNTEAAVGAAGGSVVILGFMGNIFFPLSGTLLSIAKWTPLYGYAGLARYPVSQGEVFTTQEGLMREALWIPALNVVVWLVVFGTIALLLVRRGRERQ